MNVGIGTVAAQFFSCEYLFRIFGIVSCAVWFMSSWSLIPVCLFLRVNLRRASVYSFKAVAWNLDPLTPSTGNFFWNHKNKNFDLTAAKYIWQNLVLHALTLSYSSKASYVHAMIRPYYCPLNCLKGTVSQD